MSYSPLDTEEGRLWKHYLKNQSSLSLLAMKDKSSKAVHKAKVEISRMMHLKDQSLSFCIWTFLPCLLQYMQLFGNVDQVSLLPLSTREMEKFQKGVLNCTEGEAHAWKNEAPARVVFDMLKYSPSRVSQLSILLTLRA